MKKLISALFVLLAGPLSIASVDNSQLVARHQAVIQMAIWNSCKLLGDIQVVSNEVQTERLDSGIEDRYYTTEINLWNKADGHSLEAIRLTVTSRYSDMYDHESRDWGVYSVDSITSSDVNCH